MEVKAIQIAKAGGPSVMKWTTVDVPKPKKGEVTVRHTSVGFNFIDCNHRSGRYPLEMPTGIGSEAAGVVEAVGAGVKDLKVGQRVVYIGKVGTYSEAQNVPAEICVPIPRDVSDELAAATHLKGMTVEMLVERVGKLKKGDVALMHSASGGVGLLLCQWAKARRRCDRDRVVGRQCKEIPESGWRHAIDTSKQDVVKQVQKITKGQGVDVVFDPVGKDTYEISLACLKDRGPAGEFRRRIGPGADGRS